MRRTFEDPVMKGRPMSGKATAYFLPAEGEVRELNVKRSRFRKLDPDFDAISRSELLAQLKVNGEVAGSFRYYAYRFAPFIDADTLIECADVHSAELYELAEVFCAAWPEPYEVTDFGDVLEISRVWMAPAFSNRGRFEQVTRYLVGLAEGWSVMVLKAFPLEFEGRDEEGRLDPLIRRRAAMMRHYQRIFGVQSLGGPARHDGWMYRVSPRLIDLVPPPVGYPPNP